MNDKTLRIITTPIVSATLSNVWHSEFLWERWGPYCCRCVLDTGILQLVQLILCLRIFESGCSVFTCFIASIFRLSTNHGHLSFISRTRLGDKYFSIFQRFLTWWYPDRTLSCTCKQFPRHIQRKKMNTQHIVAWASECFPDIPEFRHHAGSEVAPTWRIIFHYQATEQFEKWLRKWRLPTHLQQYWQDSLNQQWQLFREQHGPTHRRQSQLRTRTYYFSAWTSTCSSSRFARPSYHSGTQIPRLYSSDHFDCP